ncbi:MAG: alpha/beta-hydrolase N-terminal domain-containing protein, partial [Ilumatobacteraceae bacterium]
MTSTTTERVAAIVGRTVGGAVGWAEARLDPVGDASAALEGVSFLDSFTPSLMPRTSQHQGLAAGLHVLGARFVGGRLDVLQTMVIGAGASTPVSLAGRAVTFAVGQAAAMIPDQEDETLWRKGARSGGKVVRAAAFSGALYDAARPLRGRAGPRSRPLVVAAMFAGGGLYWAGRRLRHRQQVIPRWPVEQKASVPESTRVAIAVSVAGTAVGKGYLLTRRGWELYFGMGWGRTVFARGVNAAVWVGAATAAYNAAIATIGRANETVEAAYATAPQSPLVSGSPGSISNFGELGQQGRRYVTDVVTPGMIVDVMGEPAVAHPIRTYVGFNSIPLYQAGRAEMALDELERTGAFDRSYLL